MPIQFSSNLSDNRSSLDNGKSMEREQLVYTSGSTDQKYLLGGRPFLIYGSVLTFFLPLGVMTFTGIRSIQLLKRQGLLAGNLHRSLPPSTKPEYLVGMKSAPMGVKRRLVSRIASPRQIYIEMCEFGGMIRVIQFIW